MKKIFFLSMLLGFFLNYAIFAANSAACVPILAYHNIHPSKKGSMTISTQRFEEQLRWLKENGYTFLPLQTLVAYFQGKITAIPEKSVVITDDDGRKNVYTYMLPIVKKYHAPVTLFIYPSIISKEPYALTWDELRTLKQTGLFDIQDHTYSHPNFKQEKKRRSAMNYDHFVQDEFIKSQAMLNNQLGIHVTLLAWPFGIYNQYLETQAAKAGYQMAFTIDYRCAKPSDRAMAMPRYMIIQSESMRQFISHVRCNGRIHA